jgi:hypothetical protein
VKAKGDAMTKSQVVDDLTRIIATGQAFHKRMRLAVSAEEYEEIREYMLHHYGRFHARILNVPLIVESDPENPPFTIQV